MPRRYLGIDLGEQRTGLALGDDVTRLATPLSIIEIPTSREAELIGAIGRAAGAHLAPGDGLVLGLPLNMDDTEGPGAKRARAFASRLEQVLGLPVALHDERLSSADADWRMAQSGLTRGAKKQRRDALAAAAILRDYLESLRPGPFTEPDDAT